MMERPAVEIDQVRREAKDEADEQERPAQRPRMMDRKTFEDFVRSWLDEIFTNDGEEEEEEKEEPSRQYKVKKNMSRFSPWPLIDGPFLASKRLVLVFVGVCVFALTRQYHLQLSLHRQVLVVRQQQQQQQQKEPVPTRRNQEKCAILFYGLPRAFGQLVLPSIQQNVIRVNAKYHCDYFVHYYNQTVEAANRSGQGGLIHAADILQLANAVQWQEQQLQDTTTPQGASTTSTTTTSTVHFGADTNQTFYTARAQLIHEVLTARDETGQRPLYYPWMERDYVFPSTTLNILKMMHSIEAAWELMQAYGNLHGIHYTRVAMLRADVVFVTPVDIWSDGSRGQQQKDELNAKVVIPSFARYPINDRAIYGNAAAVQIWATARFDSLASHVQQFRGSGYVMHNERFVDSSLLSAIRQGGTTVVEHASWCFCRARANGRVWFNDCTKGSTTAALKRAFPDNTALLHAVEQAVNGTCQDVRREGLLGVLSAQCS